MRWIAAFAARSPPRFKRNLVVFPEDAGIGAVPASIANAPSDRNRSGLSPAVTTSCAAVTGPTPNAARNAGAARWESASICSSRSVTSSSSAAQRRASSRNTARVVSVTDPVSEAFGRNERSFACRRSASLPATPATIHCPRPRPSGPATSGQRAPPAPPHTRRSGRTSRPDALLSRGGSLPRPATPPRGTPRPRGALP